MNYEQIYLLWLEWADASLREQLEAMDGHPDMM